jgi:diguanylate cyclase (GGDEF)-like protein/PAS domain S-box-containing protein
VLDGRLATTALAVMTEAALLLDESGEVIAANRRAGEMLGDDDLAGRPVGSLLPLDASLRICERALSPVRVQLEARRSNGVPFPVEATLRALGTDDGRRVICALREPSRQELAGTAMRHFDVAFENSPIGMALFNTDGEYVRVNGALCEMLGRTPQELIGRRDQELTHPDDREADVRAAWEILDGQRDTHQAEKRFIHADGSVVWALANLTFLRDGSGRPLSWVGQFQDITERRRQEAELRHLADHDPLTGLLNRRAFSLALERHLAHGRRYGGEGALLMVDLDGFKRVNDLHGHAAGDEMLTASAEALRSRLRESDVIARLGGDEFAVLLPTGGREEAEQVARGLVDAVARRTQGAMTVSVGVAPVGCARSADALLRGADRVMYRAKRAGGDAFDVCH